MNLKIFDIKTRDAWYSDFNGKIIDLDAILKQETETEYIVDLRGDICSINKIDLNNLEELELEFDDEVIKEIEKTAKASGLTVDELINKILKEVTKNGN